MRSSSGAHDAPDAGPVATAEALARIAGLLDHVDHDGRRVMDAAGRVALVESVVAVGRRVEALRAVLVAEADHVKAAETTRGTSLRTLLSATAQVTPGEASGWVHAGRDLVTREEVRRAALAGDVSVAQARAIDGVLGELPASLDDRQRARAEQVMLDKASRMDAKLLARQTRAVLEEVAPEVDAVEDELQRLDTQRRRALAGRGLTFVPDGRGSVLLRGQLPVLEASGFERLVAAYTESDRRARERSADRLDPRAEIRSPEQRRADGLIALVQAHSAALRQPGLRTLADAAAPARSADGVEPGAGPDAPGEAFRLPSIAGDRPRLVVTLSYDLLHRCAEQAGLLPDGTSLSAGELRRLLCDADLMPAVLGGRSELLDVGREQRLVTPELRRALALRDGGCAFPGCNAPEHGCEAHHVDPWWAGGRTELGNLVLLCPHHHGTVEPLRFRGGSPPHRWRVRIADDGRPEFLPPGHPDGAATPVRHQREHRPTDEAPRADDPAAERHRDGNRGRPAEAPPVPPPLE